MADKPKDLTIKGRVSYPTFTYAEAVSRNTKSKYPKADVNMIRPSVDLLLAPSAAEKLVEVQDRIGDLVAIRDNLTAALDAGCDDLLACAAAQCCPIPFEAITLHPDSALAGRR